MPNAFAIVLWVILFASLNDRILSKNNIFSYLLIYLLSYFVKKVVKFRQIFCHFGAACEIYFTFPSGCVPSMYANFVSLLQPQIIDKSSDLGPILR